MATDEQVAALEEEWRREGRSDEDIAARLQRLADESEAEAEAPEEEPEETEEEESTPVPPADDWPLCPVCNGNGRVPPELQKARDKEPCVECHGVGMVRTGSLVADYAVMQCATCTGNGYVSRPYEVPQAERPPSEFARNW